MESLRRELTTVRSRRLTIDSALLEDLNLPDDQGVDGEDLLGRLHESSDDGVGEDLLGEHGVVHGLGGLENVVGQSLADKSDLGALGVSVLVLLVALPGGNHGHEDTEDVAVRGLDVDPDVDEALSLLEDLADGLLGDVQSVEGGVKGVTFNFLDLHLQLAVVLGVVVLEVGVRDLADSAHHVVLGNLFSDGLVCGNPSDSVASLEGRGRQESVPRFLQESVLFDLSSTFLDLFLLNHQTL